MSIDINWDTLTGGPEGLALADSIRDFVHDKFQQIPLPRFIRSVEVHTFDFGKVSPEIEIKDICDPLPDFYEEDEDDDTENGDDEETPGAVPLNSSGSIALERPSIADPHAKQRGPLNTRVEPRTNSFDQYARKQGTRDGSSVTEPLASPPFLSRAPTPGLMGGTSNLSYFHMPFSAGLSGTTTPLAAVAGAQFQHGWSESQHLQDKRHSQSATRTRAVSTASGSPPSSADPSSRPPSQHLGSLSRPQSRSGPQDAEIEPDAFTQLQLEENNRPEPDANDIQVMCHVKYSGDVKLVLTTSILLDYPMPSFVEIPVQLRITGVTFDGLAILAYIRKKAHFCFLAPEDAESVLSNDSSMDNVTAQQAARRQLAGGLLEQIKVESEIGQKNSGKQVLKNVGKVEKFILEQVRRIFEDEFVYPSFWTFLV